MWNPHFREKRMPTGTLTARLGACTLPRSALNPKAFALPSHFTDCSLAPAVHLPDATKAIAPGPLCFDQVEANHWPVEQEAVGIAWYGLSHRQPDGGHCCSPGRVVIFLTKWLKHDVVIAFTYKTNPNINPHRILSLETSCLCLAWNKTKTNLITVLWDMSVLAMHPGHIANPARKGEGHRGRVDLNYCEKNTLLGKC